MKMEQKQTELSAATFVFIFLYESMNKYGNIRNKYENRYFWKQIWNEYGMDADEKQMIVGTKRPPESCRKSQESQTKPKNLCPKPVMITRCNGGVEDGLL
jgi:hypothetical protein